MLASPTSPQHSAVSGELQRGWNSGCCSFLFWERYGGACGTVIERAFRNGQYSPPRLEDVAEAARHARGKALSIFIGLSDEGLAVADGSFLREGDGALVDELERFNRTQDFDILDRICAD